MHILDEIIAHKKIEVERRKETIPISKLIQTKNFYRKTESLAHQLLLPNTCGIIAEFKRKSPSKGIINDTAEVTYVTAAYELFGAAGISILTDQKYFGGSLTDLAESRKGLRCPILRKDFIIHEYQLIEAKAAGADVILLIAACLSAKQVKQLAEFAKSLQLEVLLEIHDEEELDHICPEIDLIGINNRNLQTFEVDLLKSMLLAEKLPAHLPKIAESGIDDVKTVIKLRERGFNGFLIGEKFMRHEDPNMAFAEFINDLNVNLDLLQRKN